MSFGHDMAIHCTHDPNNCYCCVRMVAHLDTSHQASTVPKEKFIVGEGRKGEKEEG